MTQCCKGKLADYEISAADPAQNLPVPFVFHNTKLQAHGLEIET